MGLPNMTQESKRQFDKEAMCDVKVKTFPQFINTKRFTKNLTSDCQYPMFTKISPSRIPHYT